MVEIKINPDPITLHNVSGSMQVTVTFTVEEGHNLEVLEPEIAGAWLSSAGWEVDEEDTGATGYLTLNWTANTSGADRSSEITFYAILDEEEEESKAVTVSQDRAVTQTIIPVWKDTLHTFTSDNVKLTIGNYDTRETVYSGQAIGIDNASIYINRIVDSQVEPTKVLPFTQGVVSNNPYQRFDVRVNGSIQGLYKAVYDWSYDTSVNWNTRFIGLNRPVDNKLDPRQYVFFSVWDPNGTVTTYNYVLGSTSTNISMGPNHTFILTNTQSKDSVTFRKSTSVYYRYDIDDCGKYALYYLNTVGGWDSLLIKEGTKSQNYNRTYFISDHSNQVRGFGNTIINTGITDSWTLSTRLLTDSQSKVLVKQLMSSPAVFLHDLENNTITPVNIETGDCQVQQFTTNGRKFSQYSITVSASNKTNRR